MSQHNAALFVAYHACVLAWRTRSRCCCALCQAASAAAAIRQQYNFHRFLRCALQAVLLGRMAVPRQAEQQGLEAATAAVAAVAGVAAASSAARAGTG
jgi:hypothetical protein